MPTLPPPLRRYQHSKPVIQLQASLVYVFVHVIDEQPEECGAKEGGEDECDDEACVRHDDPLEIWEKQG